MDESNAAADLLPYGSAVRLMCPLPPAFSRPRYAGHVGCCEMGTDNTRNEQEASG